MATNPKKIVSLSSAQLETLAGGGSITSGDDTYTADENTLYLIPDVIDNTPTQNSTNAVTSGGVYTALGLKEDVSNKVTSLSSNSTDTQYPSAKCVYDLIGDVESLLSQV